MFPTDSPTKTSAANVSSAPERDCSVAIKGLLDIRQSSAGLEVVQRKGKHGMRWSTLLFGVIFLAVGIGISFAPKAPIIFPIVFGGFGLFFSYYGWTLMQTGYRTIFTRDQVIHQKLSNQKVVKEQIWPLSQAIGIGAYANGSSATAGGLKKEYFTLVAQDQNHHQLIIADGIAGRELILKMVKELSNQTGIESLGLTVSRTWERKAKLAKS